MYVYPYRIYTKGIITGSHMFLVGVIIICHYLYKLTNKNENYIIYYENPEQQMMGMKIFLSVGQIKFLLIILDKFNIQVGNKSIYQEHNYYIKFIY